MVAFDANYPCSDTEEFGQRLYRIFQTGGVQAAGVDDYALTIAGKFQCSLQVEFRKILAACPGWGVSPVATKKHRSHFGQVVTGDEVEFAVGEYFAHD
ncbi:hypothetical protein A8144_12085 [Mycobacterium leprae 3125609]|nr:hypothetical protein A8144_12085 [Mycobacterium leprae 3125609]OAX70237.1 hypothetical protein A3216_13050 [Mycobacterium leprae 7935681]